jgi:DNA-binding IclR family transcriptional regulator
MSVIAWADVIDAPMTIDAIVRFDGGALGESKAAIARFSEGLTNHGLVERVYAGAYRLTNAGYAALGLPV